MGKPAKTAMPERPARAAHESARFDGDSARRILGRAAAEQQRRQNALAGSYSLDELREMAAEAGISADALRAAIKAERGGAANDLPPRRKPWHEVLAVFGGSAPLRRTILAGTGGCAFLWVLLAFPAFASAVFWVSLMLLVALSVLIVLGAAPM